MNASPSQTVSLEADLNHFDPRVRAAALARLAGMSQGDAILSAAEKPIANLHCHTFFSFNAYGHSPSSLAWLAKKIGIRLMGIVDFDVLDGVEEFLDACETLGVRGSAGMETRVYIPEFATREINSPGEPGVDYHIGIGFTTSSVSPEAAPALADLRKRAEHRNRLVVERLNAFLAPVTIDYEGDVLPLTPSGSPTERHIVLAYLIAAERAHPDPAPFWADKLGMGLAAVASQIGDAPRFQNLVRTKLIKRGGPGYIQPTPDTFPGLPEVNRLILACGAIPCVGWLDGASQGEQDIAELLDLMVRQGAGALNIVPDRNWNIPDLDLRRKKVEKLHEIVRLAAELDLPLNVGTEMNSSGQRLVDDFDAAELRPVRQAFLDGAHFIYGHTVLQRALGLGCQSAWAREQLPTRRERNAFYTKAGETIPPGRPSLDRLRELDPSSSPDDFLEQAERLFI